jgi:cbb3-type cytochrome oxidase subunit 1
MDNVLIFGVVCTLLVVSIGWWLTGEKQATKAAQSAQAALPARTAPESSEIRWGIVITIIVLSFGFPPIGCAELLGLIPACIAKKRGHSFINWWLYGSVLFPVALLHILMSKDQNKRQCHFCMENVHLDATVCPHCRNNPRAPSLTPSLSS